MSPLLLILIFFVLANLPWFGDKLFLVIPLKNLKPIYIRLIELLVYYLAALLVSIWFEMQFSGDVYQQQWEFFWVTLFMFVVLAVPGFIYRYQWLPMQQK